MQESYLAGVIYSKYRVDLNRYPGPGRYIVQKEYLILHINPGHHWTQDR